MLTINAGGLTIRSSPDPEAETVRGVYVAKDGFTGWEGSPATRRERIDIPGGHGIFPFQGKLDARQVSVDTWVVGDDQRDLGQLVRMVNSLGAAGGQFRLSVDQWGEELWADGQNAGPENGFTDTGGVGKARGLLQWECPNPRLFGAPNDYASTSLTDVATLEHWGTFEAAAVATISGTLPNGFAIYANAGAGGISVTQPVTPATPITVHLSTGRVYQGGARVLRKTIWWRPFIVPAGGSVRTNFDVIGGSGRADFTVRDTFI